MECELEALLVQQRSYEAKRNIEMRRLQRLQKRQQDLVEENAKKVQEEKKCLDKAREAGETISLACYAKYFLSDIIDTAMGAARREGVLISEANIGQDADPIMEWVEAETYKSYKKTVTGRNLLDGMKNHK